MQIGQITITPPVALAPMAGVTDLPFRLLVKEMGCGLVYTEMISDQGLLYGNARTQELLRLDPREHPVAVQLFGSTPSTLARAASLAVAAGADIIDINMGCPTPKIVKNGAGAALMRQPALAYEIMCQVVAAVSVPVTVKIRKGWDDSEVNAVELARLAERAGVQAVAVHGRTRAQFYAGTADWEIIARVKDSVAIPVIGNGDVKSPADARRLLTSTGCDGIMIGRGAQGNPWLFHQVVHYLVTGEILPPPTLRERLTMLLRHLDLMVAYKGEYIACREMRRHAAWYLRGLPGAAQLRQQFQQAARRQDFSQLVASLLATAADGESSASSGAGSR